MGHIFLMPISPRKLVGAICSFQKIYNCSDSDYLACYVDPYKREYRKEWFDEQELTKFEDYEFYIPSGYDEILRTIYGDYKKFPPISQQQPHHITNAFWK